MEINDFLIPIDFQSEPWASLATVSTSFGELVMLNQQRLSIDDADVALVSIDGDVDGDQVRQQLYRLNRISSTSRVFDLGHLKRGNGEGDLQVALQEISTYCMNQRLLLLVLSAERRLEQAVLRSYGKYDFNLLRVDSRFRLNSSSENAFGENDLSVLLQEFSNIFSFSSVAFQNYFIDNDQLTYLESLGSDLLRLGQLRDDLRQAEPLFRGAHCVSFDVSSIRSTDFPAQAEANANGLRAEELCALARYAGVGTELKTLALYGMDTMLDWRNQSAGLAAQLFWHVVESYLNGTLESPAIQRTSFEEYLVRFPDSDELLAFYKSALTGRWWFKINDRRIDEDLYVPCLESDYKSALQLDLPEIWLKYIRKFKEKS